MVWKLLKSNINPWQIAAYAAANIVGILIAGLALQFYRDTSIKHTGSTADPLGSARYIVVSHRAASSLLGSSPRGMTPEEINDISTQPWAESAAPFTPAGFDVTVSLDLGMKGFSTAIFLEGVPEEYLDVIPGSWGFDPQSPEVTIILPRDYLTLYNLGFAPARGLPTLDERTVSIAPLRVTISGNGLSQSFPGKVAGFSSRINTIAVPEEFVTWANSRFSPAGSPTPNRAIIRLADPGNPEISRYLADAGMEESAGGEASSRMCHFLRVITAAVTAIGLLICFLAAGLLILSVFLLLQKSRPTLSGLINLGYHPHTLAGYYFRLICAVNLVVLAVSSSAVGIISRWFGAKLSDLGMDCAPLWPTLAAMTALLAVLTLLSGIAVSRVIRRIWRN